MDYGFRVLHGTLPGAKERMMMARFVNARRNYPIEWLLSSVYRLMAMYNIEKAKQTKEITSYIIQSTWSTDDESKAHFKYENGDYYVLGDDGEYTKFYD